VSSARDALAEQVVRYHRVSSVAESEVASILVDSNAIG
jgi:hypothetical protein